MTRSSRASLIGLGALLLLLLAHAAPGLADDGVDIRKTLDAYKQAIEKQDLPLLRKVLPGMTEADVEGARKSFAAARQQVELTVEGISVKGDRAEVKARRRGVVTMKDGKMVNMKEDAVFIDLRRSASGWVIGAFRPIEPAPAPR